MKKDEFQQSSKTRDTTNKDSAGKGNTVVITLGAAPAAPKFQGPRPPAPRPSFAMPPIHAAVQVKLLPPEKSAASVVSVFIKKSGDDEE